MISEDLIALNKKPKLYDKGTSFMWTDPHICQQLLQVHLNPDIDLGSRKLSTIQKTAQWILETQINKPKLNILDLGCGPGLYTELFSKAGHEVTGIDISDTSIRYATKSANKKGLDINYQAASYLETDLGRDKYDLIVLIYTDLGVLQPGERDELLEKINRALKPGGKFIFDVLKDQDLKDKLSPKTWEVQKGGFWKATPYLALSESFLYEKEKVILYQHSIITDKKPEVFRFWTHFFSKSELSTMLQKVGFTSIAFTDGILPPSDMWNGDHVWFVKCEKTIE